MSTCDSRSTSSGWKTDWADQKLMGDQGFQPFLQQQDSLAASRKLQPSLFDSDYTDKSSCAMTSVSGNNVHQREEKEREEFYSEYRQSEEYSQKHRHHQHLCNNGPAKDKSWTSRINSLPMPLSNFPNVLYRSNSVSTGTNDFIGRQRETTSATRVKSSMIDIPVHQSAGSRRSRAGGPFVDSSNTVRRVNGQCTASYQRTSIPLCPDNARHTRSVCQSLPCLNANAPGKTGHWPSNVTSITTRSIIRRPPSRLCSISESEVFERDITEQKRHSQRQHTTRQGQHLQNVHSPLQVNVGEQRGVYAVIDQPGDYSHRRESSYPYRRQSEEPTYASWSQNSDTRRRRFQSWIEEQQFNSSRSVRTEHHNDQRTRMARFAAPAERSRRSSETVKTANGHHYRVELDLRDNITKLTHATDEIEDQLLRLIYIPSSIDQLNKLVEELACLQTRARFDSILADKLVAAFDNLTSRQHQHSIGWNEIIADIKRAIRLWDDILNEVEIRHRLASNVLRITRKCDVMLSIEEAWLNGVIQEEKRIRDSMNTGGEVDFACIQSLKDLRSELVSHLPRMETITDMCAELSDITDAYLSRSEQRLKSFVPPPISKLFEPVQISGQPTSTSSLIQERANRLHRNYGEVDISCRTLINQLTPILNARKFSSTMLQQQPSVSSGAMYAQVTKRQHPRGSEPAAYEMSEDALQLNDNTHKLSQVKISAVESERPKRASSHGVDRLCIDEDRICWMGEQNIFFDPVKGCLCSLNDLIADTRLRYVTRSGDPSITENGLTMANCFVFSEGNVAVAKFAHCCPTRLADVLSSREGFYDHTRDCKISLLEAITSNILSLRDGRFYNAATNDCVTLKSALQCGIVDQTGLSTIRKAFDVIESSLSSSAKLLSQYRAFFTDDSQSTENSLSLADLALSIEDYASLGLIDDKGYLIHPNTGTSISLIDAIDKKILDPYIKQIHVGVDSPKLSLTEAICQGLIETGHRPKVTHNGKYYNLNDAINAGYVIKPLSLGEAYARGLVNVDGKILHKVEGRRLDLVDAISTGIIDSQCTCMVHPVNKTPLSIGDAISSKLISRDGRFYSSASDTWIPLSDAIRSNELNLIVMTPTMRGAVVHDKQQNRMISISEAMGPYPERHDKRPTNIMIDVSKYAYIDKQSNRQIPIDQAIDVSGLILPSFRKYLGKVIVSHDDSEWAKLINGKTVEQCLIRGYIRLYEDTLCFVGAPHRVLNRREPASYLLRDDENLSMTFISIKDAVRCDLITHTDAILIREMQGCITRDAYILAYFDANANGVSQVTTSLTYSNEEAHEVSGEMSTDRTSDNTSTSITRPCKNSFQFSSSTDTDFNVHKLDNDHKFRYCSNEQDERQSRYKVTHEDWSSTARSRDTIGGNFIFRTPTCISDGFDSVKILSSEKERRRRELRTQGDLDYRQVKGDVAADDRQTRNVHIKSRLSRDVSNVAPEKTYYCDDSEQSQRIKHQHNKCNRDVELRVEQNRSQQQYFPAAAAWNRGSTVVVAADKLTQHKASFSSIEESENLITDEDAFSSSRTPAASAAASATTITAGKAVNRSDFSVTRSAEFSAGIAKQKNHEVPQERVCRSPSIRKPSPPRASLSPAFRYLHMNFIDAVNIQLLNIDTGVFKHPHAPARHISIREALDEKLINPCTAFVIDPIQCHDQDAGGPFFQEDHKAVQPSRLQGVFKVCDHAHDKERSSKTSDHSYNLQEAVDRGLITEDNRVVNRKAAGATISIAEAMKTGLMRLADSSFSYYNIISKTESLSIKSVKDTKANVYIDPNKAIKLNILDLHKGAYFDRANNRRRYSIEEAIQVGFILVENLSNRDGISQVGSMSDRRAASSKSESDTREETGHLVNVPSDHLVSTSLIRETRSYNLVGVIDALSGESLTVQQAIDSNILDYIDGRYYDRKREMWIPIIKAIYEHLIQVTRVPVTDHVDKNKRAVSETRTYALKEVRNTKTGELIGIRRAIEEGIIDQHTGLYYDLARNIAMPISLAVERNLILTEENELERHRQVPSAGPTFLRRDVKYLSIEGVIDPETRQMLSVDDAIAKRVLDTRTCSFYSMADKALISITDAYTRGYLIGKYISEDEMLNERNTIIARICREERSYLVNSVLDTENQKKLSLNEAINRGLFNADRAVYINPITSEESSLADAIINGFVDAHLVDGSRPVRTSRHRASTTKVIRVQKRPVASVSSDQDLSDVYKLDTLEEYVETMHRSDLSTAKQHQVKPDFDGESDGKKAFSTCVSHSTSHIVRRKEKNTKERDIVIQPERETIIASTIPKDSRRTEEELIIEESQTGGERVINVTNTPSFSSRPIVIEDSRPLHPVSHVVVVDDESMLDHMSHHTYVSTEEYASDKAQSTDSPSINLSVRVPTREASPKKIQTSTIRITTTYDGKPTPVTSDQRQQTTKESKFRKDVEIERSSVDQPSFHRTRESSEIAKSHGGFDMVDTESTVTKHKFIQEILDKARTYRSSIPGTDISHRKSHTDYQCTYVIQGMVHTLSWVLDPDNGKKISLDEGIERGIFTTKDMTYHDSIQKRDYDTEKAVRLGLIGTNEDCSSVVITVDGITYTIHWVLDPIIKHRILPHRAIERGVLDIEKLRYFNPQNNVSISIHEAVKMKFIGAEEKRPEVDEICVSTDNHTIIFSWVLDTIAQKHISAYDALKRGLVDVAAAVYFKQNTGDILTLWDALQSGFIGVGGSYPDIFAHDDKADSVASLDEDELTISTKTATYVITGVIHPLTQQELSVSEAIEQGILDKNTGAYRNTNTNSVYELCDAINSGLMYATIIESKESTEMETSSTKHVIQRFIINKVIDPRDGKIISGLQAQADGILNYRQGMYSDPDTNRGISIKEAIDKTLIEVELINQTSDEQFELDLIRDSLLERRITTFSIFNVIDPIIEQNISAQEAVNRGILDTDTKTYFDAGTGKYYELCDALSRGFLQADVKERVIRKPLGLSLQNAARLGFYNYDIGKFKDPGTDQIFSLKDALDKGHININGPAIACVNNSPLLLKDAFHLRLISRTTGILDRVRLEQLKGKVTNSRIFRINIEDAVRCGLLNLHTGLYKHVHTGEQLTLKGAIERGLLDGDSMIMEHPVNNKFVTLTEALGNLMIDTNGNITDLRGQCPPSTLEMEFNQRRLFSAFNVNTGELFLQRPSEMVAFEKYIQKSGSSADLAKFMVLNFQSDKEYNIMGAIEHGVLDPDSGKFFDFEHKDQMSVREAIRKGFISIIGSPVVPFKADHDTLAVRVTSRKRRLSSRTRSGGAHSIVYSPGQTKSSQSGSGGPGNADGSFDRSGIEHVSVEGVSLDNTLDSLQTHREENSVGTHDISISAGSYNTNAGNTYDVHNVNTIDSLDQLYPDCSSTARRCSNTYSTHRERLRSLNDNIRNLPYILGRISGNPCEFVSDHGKSALSRISSTGCLFPLRRSAVCMRCRRTSQNYEYLVVSEKAESVPLELTQQTEGSVVKPPLTSGSVKNKAVKPSSHLHPARLSSSLNVTSAFDSLSGMRLPIDKAMEVGIFDQCTGVFVDRRSKVFLTINEAQSAGLITVVSRPSPANIATDVNNSADESGSLSSGAASSKCRTKRRAYIVGVKNPITNRYNSVKQAVDDGILNYLTGKFKIVDTSYLQLCGSIETEVGNEIDLRQADALGFLQVLEVDDDVDPSSMTVNRDSSSIPCLSTTSHDEGWSSRVPFLTCGNIDNVYDGMTGKLVKPNVAASLGLIEERGFYVDRNTRLRITFNTAIRAGLITIKGTQETSHQEKDNKKGDVSKFIVTSECACPANVVINSRLSTVDKIISVDGTQTCPNPACQFNASSPLICNPSVQNEHERVGNPCKRDNIAVGASPNSLERSNKRSRRSITEQDRVASMSGLRNAQRKQGLFTRLKERLARRSIVEPSHPDDEFICWMFCLDRKNNENIPVSSCIDMYSRLFDAETGRLYALIPALQQGLIFLAHPDYPHVKKDYVLSESCKSVLIVDWVSPPIIDGKLNPRRKKKITLSKAIDSGFIQICNGCVHIRSNESLNKYIEVDFQDAIDRGTFKGRVFDVPQWMVDKNHYPECKDQISDIYEELMSTKGKPRESDTEKVNSLDQADSGCADKLNSLDIHQDSSNECDLCGESEISNVDTLKPWISDMNTDAHGQTMEQSECEPTLTTWKHSLGSKQDVGKSYVEPDSLMSILDTSDTQAASKFSTCLPDDGSVVGSETINDNQLDSLVNLESFDMPQKAEQIIAYHSISTEEEKGKSANLGKTSSEKPITRNSKQETVDLNRQLNQLYREIANLSKKVVTIGVSDIEELEHRLDLVQEAESQVTQLERSSNALLAKYRQLFISEHPVAENGWISAYNENIDTPVKTLKEEIFARLDVMRHANEHMKQFLQDSNSIDCVCTELEHELATVAEEQLLLDETQAACKRVEETMLKFNAKQEALESLDYSVRCVAEDLRTVADRANMFAQTQRDLHNFQPFTYPDISILSDLEAKLRVRYHDIKQRGSRLSHLLQDVSLKHLEYLANANRLLEVFDVVENELTELVNRDLGPDLEMAKRLDLLQQSLSDTTVFQKRIESYSDQLLSLEQSCTSLVDMLNSCTNIVPHQIATELRDQVTCISARYEDLQSKVSKHTEHLQGLCKAAIVSERCCQTANKYMSLIQFELSELHNKDKFNFDHPEWLVDADESSLSRLLSHLREQGFVYREFIDRMNFHLKSLSSVWSVDDNQLPRDLQIEQDVLSKVQALSDHIKDIVHDTEARQTSTDRSANMLILMQGASGNARRLVKQCDEWWSTIRQTDSPVIEKVRMPHDKRSTLSQFLSYACKAYCLPLDCSQSNVVNLRSLRSSIDQFYKLACIESSKVEAFKTDLCAQQTQASLSYYDKLQSYLDREQERLLYCIDKFSSLTEAINGYIDQKTNAIAILTDIVERLSHVSTAIGQTSVITYSIRSCEEEFERCQVQPKFYKCFSPNFHLFEIKDLSGELNRCNLLAVDLHQLIAVLSSARTNILKLLGIECTSCNFHVNDSTYNAEKNACIEDLNIERMVPSRINGVMTAVAERRQEIEKNLHDIREHTENVKSAWTALLHFQTLADDLESKGRTDYSMLSTDNQKSLEALYRDLHSRLNDGSTIMQDVRSTVIQLGIPIHSPDLALPQFNNQEVKSMVDEVNDIEFKWATLSEAIADRIINIQNHLDDLQHFEDDQSKLAEELAQTENLIYLATMSSAIGAETMGATVDKLNAGLEEHRDRQRKLKEFGILVERMAHKLEQLGHASSNHDVASSLADAQSLRMKFCQMNTFWMDLETQLCGTVQRFEAAGQVSKKVNVELDLASELLNDIEEQLKQLTVYQKDNSTVSCTDVSLQLETLNQKAKQVDHIIFNCSSVLSSYRHQCDTDSKQVHLADDLENEIHRIKSQLRKVRILLESCELEVNKRKKHAPNNSARLDEADKSDRQSVTANFKRELDLLSSIGLINDREELNNRINKLQDLSRRIAEVSENASSEEKDNAELIECASKLSFDCKQSLAWFIDCKPVIEQIDEDQKSVINGLDEIDKELQLLITCDSGSELHATGDDLVLWFDSIRTRFAETHTNPRIVDLLKEKLQVQDAIPPQWIAQNAELIESRWASINAKIQKIASANKNISSPMHSQTQDESTDRSVSLKTDTYEPRRLQKILAEVLARGFDLQCEVDKVQNDLNKENATFVEHSDSVNDFRRECNLLSFQALKLYSQLTDAVDIGELDALVVAIKADVDDLLTRTDNKDFRMKHQLLSEISTMSTELDSAVTQVQRLIARNLSFPIYPDKLRSHETELKRALDDALNVENTIDFVCTRLGTLSEGTKGQKELSDSSTTFDGLETRIQYFADSISSSKTWLIQRLDQVKLVLKPLDRFWAMVDSNEDVLKSMDVRIIDLAKRAVVDILDEHFSPTACSDQIHIFEDIERELTESLNISEIDEVLTMLCEVDFEIEDKDDLKDRSTQISKWASCLTDDICEFRDRLVIALYRFCSLTRKLRECVSWARATGDDIDALSASSTPLVDQLRTLYEYRELLEQKTAEIDINQHAISDQDMGSWLGTLSTVSLEAFNLFAAAEDDTCTLLQIWEAFDAERQTLAIKLASSIDASEQALISRKSVNFILEHIHGWLDFSLMRTRDLDASSALTSSIRSNTLQSVLRREQTLTNLQESACGQDSIVQSKIGEAKRLVSQLSELLTNGLVAEPFSKEQSSTTPGKCEESIEKQLQALSSCIDLMEHDFSRYVEIGGLPSTIIPQLNSITDTNSRMESIQAMTTRLKTMLEHSDRFYKQRFNVICERWKLIQGKMVARKTRMETCADEVIEFDNGMKSFLKSLGDFERQMPAMKIRTRGFDQLQSLAELYQEFEDLLNNAQANFLLLDKLGTKIRFKCRSGDSVILKNLLLSTNNRWTKLMNRWNERTRELHRVIIESTKFEEDCADLDQWLDKALTQLKGDTIHATDTEVDGDLINAIEDSSDELASMVERCRQTFREIECRRYNFDEIYRQCLRFSDACSQVSLEERARFRERASLISAKWRSINTLANERRKAIDSLMLIQGKVVELARSSVNWLNQVERLLTSTEGQCFGDLGTVQGLCDRYQFICSEFMSREEQLQLLLRRENKHLSEDTVRRLSSCWDRVKIALDQRGKELSESLDLATVFEQEVTDFFDWSDKMEKQLSSKNGGELYLSGDILWLSEKASLFSEWLDEIMAREESIGKIKRYAEKILSACHSTCVERISHCVVIAETRMSVILNAVNAKEDQMKQSLERMVRYDNSLSEIINRLAIIERGQCELDKRGNELLVDLSHIPQVLDGNADEENGTEMMNSAQIECVVEDAQNMLIEAEYFLAEVQSVDVLLDKLLCAHCPTKLRQHSKLRTRVFSENQSTSGGNRSPHSRSQQSSLNKMDNSSSHTDQSQGEDLSIDMGSTYYRQVKGKDQATLDNEVSSSTSMATTDLSSCLLNDQRLRDALQRLDKSRSEALFRVDSIRTYISRLKELLAIRSFDFDLWCERFKSYIGENRDKLMTWFGRIDYKRSGQVDKQDFIQTLLKSKFATSRIEVEMVADIFDRNDNGRINYKDFVSTFDAGCEIRRHNVNGDQEKIHQEVKDQCGRCRCMDRYNVQQVAEGRYRFGNAKRYRLVRILRSTVMVRVGGGWVSLAEFLSKNDPCRVQGRTNLELRDQLLSTSRELATSQHQLLHPLRNELNVGSKSATSTPVPRCKFPAHYQRNASQSPTPHHLRSKLNTPVFQANSTESVSSRAHYLSSPQIYPTNRQAGSNAERGSATDSAALDSDRSKSSTIRNHKEGSFSYHSLCPPVLSMISENTAIAQFTPSVSTAMHQASNRRRTDVDPSAMSTSRLPIMTKRSLPYNQRCITSDSQATKSSQHIPAKAWQPRSLTQPISSSTTNLSNPHRMSSSTTSLTQSRQTAISLSPLPRVSVTQYKRCLSNQSPQQTSLADERSDRPPHINRNQMQSDMAKEKRKSHASSPTSTKQNEKTSSGSVTEVNNSSDCVNGLEQTRNTMTPSSSPSKTPTS